jgi:hypothetical protein
VKARRSALIIANSVYQDAALSELRAPAADAKALDAVLSDPGIGDFEVQTLLNGTAAAVQQRVDEFFDDRDRDDLLLLHFSCHGIKDPAGALYFAAADTSLKRLMTSAVSAYLVGVLMSRTRSRRVVVLLDCCYSGAFDRGLWPRSAPELPVSDQLPAGEGRVVISASTAMEYAFEIDAPEAVLSEPRPSVFTSALVRGLRTGEADLDQNGLVTLQELYEYLFDSVRAVTPRQTPSWTGLGVQSQIVIARRAIPVTDPTPLPEHLVTAMGNSYRTVRLAAVSELESVRVGTHAGLVLAADVALQELAGDDSREVSEAASAALGRAAQIKPLTIAVPAPQAGDDSSGSAADVDSASAVGDWPTTAPGTPPVLSDQAPGDETESLGEAEPSASTFPNLDEAAGEAGQAARLPTRLRTRSLGHDWSLPRLRLPSPPDRSIEKYLASRERLVMVVRLHWVCLVPALLETIGAVALSIIAGKSSFAADHGFDQDSVTTLLWYVALFMTVRLCWKTTVWPSRIVMITDARILKLSGTFVRRVRAVHLNQITDTTFSRGPLGRLLGYGCIEVPRKTRSSMKFRLIPRPDRFYQNLGDMLFGSAPFPLDYD